MHNKIDKCYVFMKIYSIFMPENINLDVFTYLFESV